MRKNVVLQDAIAVGIHEAKAVLAVSVALLSSEAIPAYSLNGILQDAIAGAIHEAKGCLGRRRRPAVPVVAIPAMLSRSHLRRKQLNPFEGPAPMYPSGLKQTQRL